MKHKQFRDVVAEMLRHEPEGLSTFQIQDRVSEVMRSYPICFGGAIRKIPGVFKVGTVMTGSMNAHRQIVWSIDYDKYSEWRQGKC